MKDGYYLVKISDGNDSSITIEGYEDGEWFRNNDREIYKVIAYMPLPDLNDPRWKSI